MDDKTAIRATIRPWTKAVLDRDWNALLEMCTADVVFAPPGEPKVSGAELRTWLDAYPGVKSFETTFEQIEVGGELATATGAAAMTVTVEGKEIAMRIKFADIFRKLENGDWRYSHVIWNLDAPAA